MAIEARIIAVCEHGSGHGIDARDRHQPPHVAVGHRLLGDDLVALRESGAQEVELAQARIDRQPLIERQLLGSVLGMREHDLADVRLEDPGDRQRVARSEAWAAAATPAGDVTASRERAIERSGWPARTARSTPR